MVKSSRFFDGAFRLSSCQVKQFPDGFNDDELKPGLDSGGYQVKLFPG
jgi:hypothetical protein